MERIPALEQRVNTLEREISELKKDIRALDKRVDTHDNLLGKIEVIVQNLAVQWKGLETKIDQAIEGGNSKNTQAWKEVTLEAIKTIAYVTGAILAAKFFIK